MGLIKINWMDLSKMETFTLLYLFTYYVIALETVILYVFLNVGGQEKGIARIEK